MEQSQAGTVDTVVLQVKFIDGRGLERNGSTGSDGGSSSSATSISSVALAVDAGLSASPMGMVGRRDRDSAAGHRGQCDRERWP